MAEGARPPEGCNSGSLTPADPRERPERSAWRLATLSSETAACADAVNRRFYNLM